MIEVSQPFLTGEELAAVQRVFASGYLGMGPEVASFEAELSAFLGGRRVVCTSSGSAALHLACVAAGLRPGDEVLVPGVTFVASYQAITAAGATPVLCDVDPRTGLLDLASASSRFNARTRAVMPVHYAGHAGNLPAVLAFAAERNLRVIEDAAHAFGSAVAGRKVGAAADITCFSFDPIKTVTCGEGGAVVLNESAEETIVRESLRLGLAYAGGKYAAGACRQGWRYHLPDINAAIGRVQLRRFGTEIAPKRRRLHDRYRSLLGPVAGVSLLETDTGVMPHILPVLVENGRRDAVAEALARHSVRTARHYHPGYMHPYYRSEELPGVRAMMEKQLTLPLHHHMNMDDVARIVAIVQDACLL